MATEPASTPAPVSVQLESPPVVFASSQPHGVNTPMPTTTKSPSGFGTGAMVGLVAGLVANVCLVLIWGVAQGQLNPDTATTADRVGQFAAVAIVVLVFGTPVALVLGFLAGGVGGAILNETTTQHRAPIVFGLIAAAFPMVAIVIPGGNWFRLTVVGTAVCFGVIGAGAGRWFARSFLEI